MPERREAAVWVSLNPLNDTACSLICLAPLVSSGQIAKLVMSYIGSNKRLQNAYLAGEIEVELSPQGTIAERLRAGGVGVPFVLSRTGAGESMYQLSSIPLCQLRIGTFVETGGIPRKFSKTAVSDGTPSVIVAGVKKRLMNHEGVKYLYEPSITGDVAILRAWKVDKAGNCVFR